VYLQGELRNQLDVQKKNRDQLDSMKRKLYDTRDYLESIQREKSELQHTIEKWQNMIYSPNNPSQTGMSPIRMTSRLSTPPLRTPIGAYDHIPASSTFSESIYSPDIELDKLLLSSKYPPSNIN
jgi:hypothetical protein